MRFSTSARRGLAFVALATASTLVAAGCSAGSLGSSTDTGEGGEAVTLTYLLGGNDDATVASAAKLVEAFQAAGGSMVMLAKGNRSQQVTDACARHGGFYLGSIGGPAARLAQDCIKHVEVVEYAELGMEAVWKIEVEDFPAFVVVDDKGNDFFASLTKPLATTIPKRPGLV